MELRKTMQQACWSLCAWFFLSYHETSFSMIYKVLRTGRAAYERGIKAALPRMLFWKSVSNERARRAARARNKSTHKKKVINQP